MFFEGDVVGRGGLSISATAALVFLEHHKYLEGSQWTVPWMDRCCVGDNLLVDVRGPRSEEQQWPK